MSLIKSYLHQKMTETTDNIIDRDELQEKLIQWDLSQMSLDDLKEYFVNMQNAELDCLSVDELIEEVEQYNPHLLES
jgi:hypothetical protein